MTIDRTTKALLLALTLGVWGLLLRPVVSPMEGRAAAPAGSSVAIAAEGSSSGVYVAAPAGQSGSVYRFEVYPRPRKKLLGRYGP